MPFVTLLTNLSRSQLPANIMPRLTSHIAVVLNKPHPAFNWILETDKVMAKGPENEGKPCVYLKIESIAVFKDSDNCKKIMPQLFEFFTKELGMPEEQILVTLHDLEAFRTGKNSMTMEEFNAKK